VWGGTTPAAQSPIEPDWAATGQKDKCEERERKLLARPFTLFFVSTSHCNQEMTKKEQNVIHPKTKLYRRLSQIEDNVTIITALIRTP
jgi:hypothetical protein